MKEKILEMLKKELKEVEGMNDDIVDGGIELTLLNGSTFDVLNILKGKEVELRKMIRMIEEMED